jgi:hypothetical protein
VQVPGGNCAFATLEGRAQGMCIDAVAFYVKLTGRIELCSRGVSVLCKDMGGGRVNWYLCNVRARRIRRKIAPVTPRDGGVVRLVRSTDTGVTAGRSSYIFCMKTSGAVADGSPAHRCRAARRDNRFTELCSGSLAEAGAYVESVSAAQGGDAPRHSVGLEWERLTGKWELPRIFTAAGHSHESRQDGR